MKSKAIVLFRRYPPPMIYVPPLIINVKKYCPIWIRNYF